MCKKILYTQRDMKEENIRCSEMNILFMQTKKPPYIFNINKIFIGRNVKQHEDDELFIF